MVRSRLGQNSVSERRICRVLGQSRSTQRYVRRQPDDDRQLINELRRWVGSVANEFTSCCWARAGG